MLVKGWDDDDRFRLRQQQQKHLVHLSLSLGNAMMMDRECSGLARSTTLFAPLGYTNYHSANGPLQVRLIESNRSSHSHGPSETCE